MAERRTSGATTVIAADGGRTPFLRGVLTHHLVKRGLEFDDAYALANALKSRFSDREELEAAELRDAVEEELESRFASRTILPRPTRVRVTYGGDAQPFSRGLMAQSLVAAGLAYERAYQLVLAIHGDLVHDGVDRIDNRELALRVAEHLEEHESDTVARRYRLLRSVNALPRPLVVYLGGVSGTGKSTLALEVAPLLRIYRINSTDTIRQVMRMVFSPAMLPSLHRSTFETDPGAGTGAEVEAALEEQATQVCVGVRAVVERAIAENLSIFVEGVHLLPPHVPFPDLDGAAYQLYVLMTTLDEEIHRSHLLARSRQSPRPAARYLDHLPVIRRHQSMLLERAAELELPVVDTSDRDGSASQTARVIVDHLEKRLPVTATRRRGNSKALLLLLDGLPDQGLRSLGGRTPLEAAHTPHLDALASSGITGLADPVGEGIVPDTAAGTLAAFGVSPHSMKRGPIEAVGAGLVLEPDDIALRANLASFDDQGLIMDRRAGRIRRDAPELAAALDGVVVQPASGGPVTVLARAATEHRVAIVLRGDDLSGQIQCSDPGDAAPTGPPLDPVALLPGDATAQRTAEALRLFEQRARQILRDHPVNRRRAEEGLPPANGLLSRGPGRFHTVTPPTRSGTALSIACISGDLTVLGVSRSLGGAALTDPAITANLDTRIDRKFDMAMEALRRHDLVVVHFKGADIAAHDQRVDEKVRFIERLDVELGRFLNTSSIQRLRAEGGLDVLVASDHATFSESGQHGPDPVPVLASGRHQPRDEVRAFNERAVREGGLGRFPLEQFVPRIFDASLAPLRT